MEKTNMVVFRSCNQMHFGCEIIDRGSYYEIRVQGLKDEWRSAYFDREETVLGAVVKMIERYGNPCYQKTGFVFREKEGRKWAHRATLSRVVFNAYYPCKTDEEYRNVTHCDGNPFNLRRKNLRRRFEFKTVKLCGGNYILLKYTTKTGKVRYAITEFDPELAQIVGSRCWCYEDNKGVFTTDVDGVAYNLPWVVWAFHYCGLTSDNWKEKIKQIKRTFRDQGLTVDHKKSASLVIGKFDNRYKNLHMLPLGLNSSKGSCTSCLPENCFFVPTIEGAVYGRVNASDGKVFVCQMRNTPDEQAVADLRHFCKKGCFRDGVEYTTLDWNSDDAKEIMMAAYAETKFGMEVYNLC